MRSFTLIIAASCILIFVIIILIAAKKQKVNHATALFLLALVIPFVPPL